ncbi:MAG TPA: hypothetical protein VH722_16775, partial [Alphaproteobacteria bacterium]|nr:hypothetical protein [Alphaproteobacteria bacterium]
MTDDEPAQSNSGRGWLVPVAIAFAVGFLVLSGFYVAVDTFAPPKQPNGKDTPTLSEPTTFQTILKSV